jgi:hypothetical protein
MKTAPYKVAFAFRPISVLEQGRNRGWIDGFTTARAAKAEVARVNEKSDKHGVTAEYLGKEGAK